MGSSLKDIIAYVKEFYSLAGNNLVLLFLLNLIAAVFELIGIGLLLPVLNIGFESQGADLFSKIFQEASETLGVTPNISNLLIILTAIYLLKGVVMFNVIYFGNNLAIDVKENLQLLIIKRLSNSTFTYCNSLQSGWLNNILMKETNLLTQGFLEFARMQTTLFFLVIYFLTASIIQLDVILIFFTFVFVLTFPLKRFMSLVRNISRDWTEKSGTVSASFIQFFENLAYAKATATIPFMLNDTQIKITNMNRVEKKLLMYSSLFKAASEPIAVLGLAILIYKQVVIEEIPLSEVIVLGLVAFRSIGQFMDLQGQYQRFNSTCGSIEIVKSNLTNLQEHAEQNGKININAIESIEFINVSTNYGSKTILNGLNLMVPINKMTGITGASGSGKTTIFYTLTGFLSPNKGKLLINGIDINQINKSTFRSRIGYLPQTPTFVSGTILENIFISGIPTRNYKNTAKLNKLLKLVGLDDFVNRLNEDIGERGLKLSGGQRQRLALVRELLRDTDILILDEATSALDQKNDKAVIKLLTKLKNIKTILIISHKPSNLKMCDIVYTVKNGATYVENLA